ncbi:restriction endonuclease [Dactylosporangium matsuzakiense]|uniref:Restriction endonuclease type IV Mrr domain-containing protein n=1 Tax=Dactylosporangium matsuzakiense TaxID=53360 RepID=A0A9W6NQI2_9ACTN|nr:restriction endonuclease [Dactylosporangium matsuzakiense]GLL05142.1 hypothetical protein GCM10017581_068890 [Dactylosporangium matsuzakiense]
MSDYRDYENGVADVLAFLAGSSAVVERNVMLPGRSGKRRQVDVTVGGRFSGLTQQFMIVDCKRWKSAVDIKDVESFIGMVNDVGADIGLLMTTVGVTDGGWQRARQERGLTVGVMTVEDLRAWSPPGTVFLDLRIPADRRTDAERALRNPGFRVADAGYIPDSVLDVTIQVFRHYGVYPPPVEVQEQHIALAHDTLRRIGVEPVHVAHGITNQGGTPAHRWLEVTAYGMPTGFKIVAADEAEAAQGLDNFSPLFAQSGIPRAALSLIRPDGWPFPKLFGL